MVTLFLALALIVLLVLVARYYLAGEDLSPHQEPRPTIMNEGLALSEGHGYIANLLSTRQSLAGNNGAAEPASDTKVAKGKKEGKIAKMRARMDSLGDNVVFDGEIVAVDSNGIKGEWLIPAGSDDQNRMLYIHGGAFLMGSPHSHRAITARYAKIIGGPVFSLDYCLMPENSRQAGIEDCRRAYQWLLSQGPGGDCSATNLYISGDSAGGNLSLALSHWIRDKGLQAPRAVIALSPATDSTCSSPSFSNNVASDIMLGPMLGPLVKLPSSLLMWFFVFTNRFRPANPLVSPLHATLENLPPTLVHASHGEMLLDDAVRYVNKARAAGSPATLQVWSGMIHVWHIFVDTIPEAKHAFSEIEKFINTHRQS